MSLIGILSKKIKKDKRKRRSNKDDRFRSKYVQIVEPQKFLNPIKVYRIPGDFIFFEDGKLKVAGFSSFNHFKRVNGIEYNKRLGVLTIDMVENSNIPPCPWEYLVDRLKRYNPCLLSKIILKKGIPEIHPEFSESVLPDFRKCIKVALNNESASEEFNSEIMTIDSKIKPIFFKYYNFHAYHKQGGFESEFIVTIKENPNLKATQCSLPYPNIEEELEGYSITTETSFKNFMDEEFSSSSFQIDKICGYRELTFWVLYL